MADETATTESVVGTGMDQAVSSPATTVDQDPGTDSTPGSETTPAQDSFTSLDPASLAPELQAMYKSMQGDYTRKTQEFAQAKSEADQLRQKASAFDGLMGDEKFVNFMNAATKQATPEASPLTGADLLTQIIENPQRLNELIKEEAQRLIDPVAADLYTDKAKAEYSQLLEKYPDLPEYEAQVAEKVENIPPNAKFTVEDAIKAVRYERALQQGINQGAKAVAKRDSASQPNNAGSNVTQPKANQSFRQAMQDALDAAGVSLKP